LTTILSNQEPLKTNSAISICQGWEDHCGRFLFDLCICFS